MIMKKYETEQENFWAGEFGNEYIKRNNSQDILAMKIKCFSRMLKSVTGGDVNSCLELGANVGLNLQALKCLIPTISGTAVEINSTAASECEKISNFKVINDSIFDFSDNEKYDLTFTSGVLIHINPDKLDNVYQKLYEYSNKYILMSEYYNPTPVTINYRNNSEKLFKRDFAGEFMSLYDDVELLDYGFIYHGDRFCPADDATWFLMRKRK